VKLVRFLTVAAMFMAALLAAIYGVFALTFNEPGGGSTYVTFAGHRLDAYLVGAVSLLIGVAIIAAVVIQVRGGRLRA
jgi:hypothetical protein